MTPLLLWFVLISTQRYFELRQISQFERFETDNNRSMRRIHTISYWAVGQGKQGLNRQHAEEHEDVGYWSTDSTSCSGIRCVWKYNIDSYISQLHSRSCTWVWTIGHRSSTREKAQGEGSAYRRLSILGIIASLHAKRHAQLFIGVTFVNLLPLFPYHCHSCLLSWLLTASAISAPFYALLFPAEIPSLSDRCPIIRRSKQTLLHHNRYFGRHSHNVHQHLLISIRFIVGLQLTGEQLLCV